MFLLYLFAEIKKEINIKKHLLKQDDYMKLHRFFFRSFYNAKKMLFLNIKFSKKYFLMFHMFASYDLLRTSFLQLP